MKSRRVFIVAKDIPYYLLIVLAFYLVVVYAPLLYNSLTFKGYIRDVISSPDRYETYAMRALILSEAERRGFLVDDVYIEPKDDEMVARVRWHVVVRNLGIYKHRLDFNSDVSIKVANF